MTKALFGLAALAVGSFARAQYPGEDRIFQAFDKLRLEDKLYLNLSGTDTVGSAATAISTQVYWFWDTSGTNPSAKVEVMQYESGLPVHRIVGDGDNLYDYDLLHQRYSVTNYGGFGSARPSTYIPGLMYYITKLSQGREAMATRLLREIHDTDASSTYRSWMPGMAPSLVAGSVSDPVVHSRIYVDTPTTDYYIYNGAPRHSITFELADDSTPTYALKNIYNSERVTVGSRSHLIDWILSPYTGVVFATTNFEPYTYSQIRGWRPVVGPQPFKG